MEKEKTLDSIRVYIKNWNSVQYGEVKPKNDSEFINLFISFLQDIAQEEDLSFDGEGAYFGKQVTINHERNSRYSDTLICFEIAYDSENIRVYTSNHHGYWTPEYIALSILHEDFDRLKTALFDFLKRGFGI